MEQYKSDIYHSKEGRHLLHNLYRKHLMMVNVPVSEQMVQTRFGDTHIVFYGSQQGKPVLFFYGEYAINPLSVRPFAHGLDLSKILLIVPDPVGQVGFSAERRLSFSKKEYGEWACQVMDALGLPNVPVLGYSFGASIALQLCVTSLLRVERLLLVNPSGILSTSKSKIVKLVSPAVKKQRVVTNDEVRKSLIPIVSSQQDELIEVAKMLFEHAKFEQKGINRLKKNEFRKFKSLVYLITEKSDYLFPGEAVMKRARKIIPHIEGMRLLSLGGHYGFHKEGEEDLKECYSAMSDFMFRTSVNPISLS